MRPIGKGSRFLVLSGVYIGRVGTVARQDGQRPWLWALDLGEGDEIGLEQSDADGPGFKRLPDAPEEVDPLFAEIEETRTAVDGPNEAADGMRNWLIDLEDVDTDADSDDWTEAHRAAFVELARLALAGIRSIDRR